MNSCISNVTTDEFKEIREQIRILKRCISVDDMRKVKDLIQPWSPELHRIINLVNKMDGLVGKKINSIKIDESANILSFYTDDGILSYTTISECCSISWFSEITGYEALIDAVVTEVEEIEVYEEDISPALKESFKIYKHAFEAFNRKLDEDYAKVYCYKLKTTKGYADIVFRNARNGSYNGILTIFNEELPANMITIHDDWSF